MTVIVSIRFGGLLEKVKDALRYAPLQAVHGERQKGPGLDLNQREALEGQRAVSHLSIFLSLIDELGTQGVEIACRQGEECSPCRWLHLRRGEVLSRLDKGRAIPIRAAHHEVDQSGGADGEVVADRHLGVTPEGVLDFC
ncbi:MAG TPA: hypothetical protein VGL57_02470 [Solirubrobacteraceae bacterium]